MTRNSSFFKVVHCREEEEHETSEYEFDNALERSTRKEDGWNQDWRGDGTG